MHAVVTWFSLYWLSLLLAGAAGWLAGRMVRGRNPALAPSLAIGVLGWLLGLGAERLLGIGLYGFPLPLTHFLVALLGSILLWVALRLLKRA
jgi:uncharacterized membrane protein YeaQ/YmgE (transglycosylase-associated protein family)